MTAEEKGFLASIKKNPNDAIARGAYADWLDEHDRPYEALLQRGKAGLSEVHFKLRRKSDVMFSEGPDRRRGAIRWSTKGKMWRKLSDLHGHLKSTPYGTTASTIETPAKDLEIVVIEVRAAVATTMPGGAGENYADRSERSIWCTVTELRSGGEAGAAGMTKRAGNGPTRSKNAHVTPSRLFKYIRHVRVGREVLQDEHLLLGSRLELRCRFAALDCIDQSDA